MEPIDLREVLTPDDARFVILNRLNCYQFSTWHKAQDDDFFASFPTLTEQIRQYPKVREAVQRIERLKATAVEADADLDRLHRNAPGDTISIDQAERKAERARTRWLNAVGGEQALEQAAPRALSLDIGGLNILTAPEASVPDQYHAAFPGLRFISDVIRFLDKTEAIPQLVKFFRSHGVERAGSAAATYWTLIEG